MSKKNSVKNQSVEELNRLVVDTRNELRDLRFSVAGSKNRNVKLTSVLRKKVARALTCLTARQAELNAQATAKK